VIDTVNSRDPCGRPRASRAGGARDAASCTQLQLALEDLEQALAQSEVLIGNSAYRRFLKSIKPALPIWIWPEAIR
jgi:hypothetical protein